MFRDEPNSLEEMLAWGMINERIYRMYSKTDFETAKSEIQQHWGYQTWVYGVHHIAEYIVKSKINVASFTRNEWAMHCIKLAKGKMHATAPITVYNRLVQRN